MTKGSDAEAKEFQEFVEKEKIFDFVRLTAARLDEENLDLWFEMFAPVSSYQIATSSPEIETDMSWWNSNQDELKKIITEVPEHVRDRAKRLHLLTPISAEINENRASVLTHFSIFRTDTDGRSSLYVTGRYNDEILKINGDWYYETHNVKLDTRILEPFTHLPL